MTRKRAIDRLMEELHWPEDYRKYLERIVLRLTDSADSLDKDTCDNVKKYILNL